MEVVADRSGTDHDLDDGDTPDGMSIEDRAKNGEHEEEEDDGTDQLVIEGTGTKLSSNVGGKKPNESLFKMSGVSLPIKNGLQIEKDTEIWIAIPVAIDDVRVHNRRKKREIVATIRTHTAVPVGQPVVLDHSPLAD